MINHKKILICVWLGYGLTILALVGNSLGQGSALFDSLLFMVGFTLPLLITSIIITLEVKKNYTNSSEEPKEVVETPKEKTEKFSKDQKIVIILSSILVVVALVVTLVISFMH